MIYWMVKLVIHLHILFGFLHYHFFTKKEKTRMKRLLGKCTLDWPIFTLEKFDLEIFDELISKMLKFLIFDHFFLFPLYIL